MELSEIIPHIEVLIFASDKPLTSLDIVELINNSFGFLEERISLDQVETAVEGIREKYAAEFYPFEVRESGGGWQFLTKKDYHKTIAQLNGDKFLKRLSNAALETLAIIGYKQPITKGEIEAIRGVNSDYSIQKLLEKELILISGRNEQLPGKPLVYATSKTFMDYFGINSAADLPKIKEVLADQIVEGTIIKPEDFTDNQIANAMAQLPSDEVVPDEEIIDGDVSDLTVNEEGELIIAELNESSDSEEASTDESSDETNDDSENLSTDVEDENNPQ
ncbi:MAG: SMC-Scp complex subunit ScpB [Sediminibacterium sp.]|uniref:SMC-Scp complex subunit ScpB n=1 Tax=Sediminibacterium sp. TaxID=1917865 RepID=UPI002716FA78|nr:SMC-Scp complex subunit ScpB [Sediminibacterium sp.]MDO8995108.1 SMC-Scp complex subunit ScpB [Sediminibacterium sp.]MDP1974125.1 SMC-Scp complex subunit ScpB [Sediminibacterium sp.]